jgi:hypothetical protein
VIEGARRLVEIPAAARYPNLRSSIVEDARRAVSLGLLLARSPEPCAQMVRQYASSVAISHQAIEFSSLDRGLAGVLANGVAPPFSNSTMSKRSQKKKNP